MNKVINKKMFIKRLSLLMGLIAIFVLFNISKLTVKADVASKPQFVVTTDYYEPENPKVGEDITIHGTIKPQPFEIPIPKKEIVLVLDISGSMNGTKIDNLKTAAKNFVSTMKDEPNVKIGIVIFSTNATIKEPLTPASNSNELINVINNLSAGGGTNTGEGLRKAAYELSSSLIQDSTANKTIIFMSDGEPTYYNEEYNNTWVNNPYWPYYGGWQKTDAGYYTNINEESNSNSNITVQVQGPGSSDDQQGNCLNYATTIGALIKAKGYNVFSIGYGLDDSGNTKMEKIHDSMSGKSGNFFATDTGAIDSVFKTIAAEIQDTYPITNINFNLNSNDGTTIEVVGGNAISLDDINYKKISESNGMVLYEADPVPFTITIKSKIAGDNIPVFTNSTITFPWNSETITATVPSINISVKDNQLPNIEATLANIDKSPCKLGDQVKVTYNINPQDFQYSDMSTQLVPKDVVVVLDTSLSMKTIIDGNGEGSGGGPLISTLWVNLLKNQLLDNKNIKFGIVTADSKSEIKSYLNDGNSLQSVVKDIDSSYDSTSDMKLAMENADKVLNGDGSRQNSNKYVVLISMGELKNEDEAKEVLKNKGYNIVSMTFESSDNNNLQEFHNDLINNGNHGTIQDDFIIAGDKHNNIQGGMDEIANRLNADTSYETYNFSNVKLNFDLNGNFDAVSGLDGSGDKRSISIPNIQYTNNNGTWHADSQTISFTIKPNKIGHLSFKENTDINNLANAISYTGINQIINKAIATPTVDVISPITVNHGVYGGIDTESKEPIINPSNNSKYPKNAIVPMAASFDFYTSTTIQLTLNQNISIDGDVRICKINNDGSLTTVATISNNNSTNYSTSIGDGLVAGDKILILYNAKLPDQEGSFTNSVTVGTNTAYATLNVKGKLPDLF